MTATAVVVVLGARVFSQQGLFLAGGVITDRFGPRRAMLAGCLMRISGCLTLAICGEIGAIAGPLAGALGPLYSGAAQPGPDTVWPWAVMAALTAMPAVGLSRLLPPQR
jgi:hypothetical protein